MESIAIEGGHFMSRKYIIRDPLALLREGVIRSRGYAIWRSNLFVAEAIADIVKPCFGPKGYSKLVIDKFSEGTVTNHGAAILEKLDLHHPTAKIIKEAAITVDKTVGDGTKTTTILIGELLKRSAELATMNVKVNTIIQGYMIAYYKALERLQSLSVTFNSIDTVIVKESVKTLFNSRSLSHADHLSQLATQAIMLVINKDGCSSKPLDIDSIRIVRKTGGSFSDSTVLEGVLIKKQVAHPAMPRFIKNAKIAVLNMALKIDEFRHLQPYKYRIDIKDPNSVSQFKMEEAEVVKRMVDKLISSGANVVICRKRIGSVAKQLLARAGVLGISRLLNEKDFMSVAKITGARVVSSLEDLKEEDLGYANVVKEVVIGEERMLVIEGCGKAAGATILLRGFSENLLNDMEHAFKDSITYVSSLLDGSAYLPGGGAVEQALAVAIRGEALKHTGKVQEAILTCADALETIPRLLAENSGYDPIDVITELREKHEKGECYYGFNALNGKVCDTLESKIIESYKMKEQVLKTTFETAITILRIDDLIDRRYAKRHEGELGGD